MSINDSSFEELIIEAKLTVSEFVVQSKFLLEGGLLPIVAAFGFLGK